ncbi:MAG: ribonuclease III [Eubacteriales bacterium]|jgi:ribonuclease-3
MEKLQQTLGYTFQDESLLRQALSHSSYANEHKGQGLVCNERLEFLGDSVLSLMVSQYIYHECKRLPEGELTKIRAAVVCEQSLYQAAKKLGLGEYLLLGKGEEMTHGRERTSILADAFEAVIAAIYLDSGFESVKNIILPRLEESIHEAVKGKLNRDFKTLLQEIVQQNREEQLRYVLVGEEGPDHNKRFFVEVHLNSNVIGRGEGRSKKEAEQMAAHQALELMGEA